MPRHPTHALSYTAIAVVGGLIPAEELTRLTLLADPAATEQTEAHYRIPRGLKLRDEIARDFKIALNLWQDFQALRQRAAFAGGAPAHELTVRAWLLPLLRDVLHFADAARCPALQHAGHSYAVGHAAAGGRVPLVLAGVDEPLDTASERFGEPHPDTGKVRRRSPFMLAQEALNASDAALWAIVSNGLSLRILRDNASLTRPAYIAVDLEALFTQELLADFSALWLLAHASRFMPIEGAADAPPADCPWERWRSMGQQTGITVRGQLRHQVAQALRALGTGFLRHPANTALRSALQSTLRSEDGGYSRQTFFEELLRLVYRLIFLATIEDRRDPATGERLVFTLDASAQAKARYLAGYSMTWLRSRAVRRSAHDRHSDLWQALSISFGALAQGERALGLPALGGLFATEAGARLDGAQIDNRHLLEAIFQLGWFRAEGSLSRVNYRDMGPEELGSVYESLLELVPDLQHLSQPTHARLAFVGDDASDASTQGNTRKLTGSYYTPDSLVQQLITSALDPVIAQTLKANPQQPVQALLALTVCDPACGSGHFLLSAARRLADAVALQRAATERDGGAPTPADYRQALRDVVGHCIYGVDKNPMAIALAKTALWLEAYTPAAPLSFIDHHLRVGDALLGVLSPAILLGGIPEAAYTPLSGDDKASAASLKKQNKAELASWRQAQAGDLFNPATLAPAALAVEHLADDTLDGIAAKRSAWAQAQHQAQASLSARVADAFVAAFLTPKTPEHQARVPRSGHLWGWLHEKQPNSAQAQVEHAQSASEDIATAAHALCRAHSVFHWWLAFPQVAAQGGFDVMLGNPPWEMLQLDPQEFFASQAPSIANAQHMAARNRMIAALEDERPHLFQEYWNAVRSMEAMQVFVHASGRYPTSGFGRINLASLFAETILQATALDSSGRAGLVLPSGIATDSFTQHLFNEIARRGLVSLFDFENREATFPGVHRSYKFCLMTLGRVTETKFQFFAANTSHLTDKNRQFTLSAADFELLNPNTRTCPVFRSNADAELTKKLYRSTPVLWREAEQDADGNILRPEQNPWNLQFQLMFMMNTDSHLFLDAPAPTGAAPRLPLYEAKMIHQFDHRWATYTDSATGGVETADVSDAQKANPHCTVRPRYWVDERQVLARIARVPSRVANAWLAWHGAQGSSTQPEATAALTLALATWWAASRFAGALFKQNRTQAQVERAQTASLFEADDTPSAQPASATPSPAQLEKALTATEVELALHHPVLHAALSGTYPSRSKLLAALHTWVRQDDPARGLPLTDAEAAQLAQWQRPDASDSGAASAYSARAKAHFEAQLPQLDSWLDRRSPRWLMGWRDICRATDERTVIASVVPRVGVGNKIPLFFPNALISAAQSAALLGNLLSLTLDFAARQKIGGTTLNYFYLKQFPVLPPDRYTPADLAFVVPRVLELTHTAHDMQPWADELLAAFPGADPRPPHGRTTPLPPFAWNPERRAQLRAELDAYYARLYGLSRDELRYILDPADVLGADYPSETFRVLKDKELREHGEYRTQRLVLAAWDALQNS